jgi:hypothetical protein
MAQDAFIFSFVRIEQFIPSLPLFFLSMPPKATAAKRKHAAAAAASASAPAAAAAADSTASKKAKTRDSTTAASVAAAVALPPLHSYHVVLSAMDFGALFSTDVDPLHLFPVDSPWRLRIDMGVVPVVRQKKQKKIAGDDGQAQRDFLKRFKEELGTTLLAAATESEAAVLAAENARAADIAAGKKKVTASATTTRAKGWFRDGRLEARIRLSVDVATDYNPATEGGELDANLTVRALVHSDSPADTSLIYLHYDSDELGGEAALLTRGSEVYVVAQPALGPRVALCSSTFVAMYGGGGEVDEDDDAGDDEEKEQPDEDTGLGLGLNEESDRTNPAQILQAIEKKIKPFL